MSSSSTHRVYNFGAGPAVLPEPVLEEAQRDLMALPGLGMSVLEISHRSAAFERILGRAEADLRALTGLSDDYHVLFLQGGASLQFAMVPMNLLPPGEVADYALTGSWAKKAAAEAERIGRVNVCATTEDDGFARDPGSRRAAAHAGRRLPAPDLQQHHRRHAVAGPAPGGGRPRWWSTRRPTC